MKRLIAFISILMLASIVADATAVSITINGRNKSEAQTNTTCYGCNNTISVQAWNTSYVKNISVQSVNASGDVVSFNISNVTGYQVQELKVNGTSINAYQAGANGMLNFSYTVTGNKTFVLSPAPNVNGYNFTWIKVIPNPVSFTKQSVFPCAAGTVYQNSNSSELHLNTWMIRTGASVVLRILTDSNNPPTTLVTANGNIGSSETNMTASAMILANNYWMIADITSGATVNCVLWR